MSPEITFDYSILEYNSRTKQDQTVAQFSVSDEAILNIVAEESYAHTLQRYYPYGVESSDGKTHFSIDLNEAPVDVIAIALGLPGHTPDFRAALQKANDGFTSYAHVFNLALEGHPLQSGRVETNTPKNRLVGIDEQKLVHLDDRLDEIPNLPGILGAIRESEADLHIQNVMIKDGNVLIPGYIVTAAEGVNATNLVDRIAIMAAYLEEAGKVNDTKSDKRKKVGVLSDGRPYAVFSDSTRSMVTIQSVENSTRNPNKVLMVVKREDLYAKKGVELNPAHLRTQEASFASHFQVNTLNRVVEDRLSTMPSPTAYFKEDGKAHVTAPKLGRETSIESLMALRDVFAANGHTTLNIAQRQQGLMPSENMGLIDTVRMRIRALGTVAMDIRRELEDRIHLSNMEQKPVERFYSNEISLSM